MSLMTGMKILDENGIRRIVGAACRILEMTGIMVENEEILARLADFGGEIDPVKQRVYFKKEFTESFLDDSDKLNTDDGAVTFTAAAEIYQGYYLDPEDGQFREWTGKRLLDYVKLAKSLPNISGISMLGCPLKEVPFNLQPLYEKLYCWKYGINGGCSIWDTGLCGKIYDMWEIYAGVTGKNIKEVYNGTVYMISPLKFGNVEAGQFMFFCKKGLATNIGTLGSLGGTTPVTLAGALSLQLAELFFINIMKRAFLGDRILKLGNSLSVIDMSTGAFQYGRPEQTLLNIAGAQVAKYLGARFGGHGGLSDAKAPGHEAGVQKVSSAIFNAMAYGHGHIAAGLLGVDEIFSPVQMILDDEITGALKRICSGFETDDESIALDVIFETGPGGSFLAAEHTARNFRDSLWQTGLWSREMFSVWNDRGRKNDIDKAKEKVLGILSDGKSVQPQISEDTEKRLLQIINK